MNCTTCKNPIQANSTECEWCGNLIEITNPSYSLILIDNGRKSLLALVKEIIDLTGLTISEAKKIVDTENSIILKTNDLNLANYIKEKLEELGATVQVSS
jgi:ribosomal protein L7/L12